MGTVRNVVILHGKWKNNITKVQEAERLLVDWMLSKTELYQLTEDYHFQSYESVYFSEPHGIPKPITKFQITCNSRLSDGELAVIVNKEKEG